MKTLKALFLLSPLVPVFCHTAPPLIYNAPSIESPYGSDLQQDLSRIDPSAPEAHLARAVTYGDLVKTRELLDSGVNKDGLSSGVTPLALAAFYSYMPIIDLLLKKGAHLNVEKEGLPPLTAAVSGRNPSTSLVQLFLDHGALPDAIDRDGKTALHKAAERDLMDIAEILIKAQANPSLKDAYSKTPFDYAPAGSPLAQRLKNYQDSLS